MGNNIVRGPAFEALPGRKLEKMKENKAERSKKGFFSLCTGSQTGAKSSIFEHNSASASVSPSSLPFKDLVAKGHSSFNKFVSLDHSPVTGTSVKPSLRASGNQSDLVTEAFLDPSFVSQVRGLEAMLRVRERIGPAAFETDSHGLSSEFGTGGHDASLLAVAGSGQCDVELDTALEPALQRSSMDPEAGVKDVTSCSSLHTRIGRLDSSISAHVSSHARSPVPLTVSCLARPAVVAAVASPVVSRARSYAQVAAAACDDAVALHNSSLRSRNSGGTGGLLPVQRSTSYRLDNSRLGSNSRRKVRQCSTIGSRSVVQTVDMSPAPAAGTYRRSADKVHDQRQVSRKRQAESSGGGPGPGPGAGPGGRSRLVGGALDRAAAFRGIPCSLVMPPGRHQRAPQSLGWAWVCGTEKSGVWVLKGDARTYNLPRNLDDVGVVWEHRSGYETAWATPGHVCSCSYNYGRGPVLPQANPSVFTEAVNLWSRVASLLAPWCAKGEVPTGVNLNRYAGDGSCIPWHCDNERLFGSPSEPKVIVSMSLGHSVLFKLCRRASENTTSQIWLDHGDLLVIDGLTQYEYLHSTASELEGPRVNLTYRWISQHIRSCPLAGLIGGALPSDAQDLAEPHSRGGESRKSK